MGLQRSLGWVRRQRRVAGERGMRCRAAEVGAAMEAQWHGGDGAVAQGDGYGGCDGGAWRLRRWSRVAGCGDGLRWRWRAAKMGATAPVQGGRSQAAAGRP